MSFLRARIGLLEMISQKSCLTGTHVASAAELNVTSILQSLDSRT